MAGVVSKRKILLMGKNGSGKTSMRSMIFANYKADYTKDLTATDEVERSQYKLLGCVVLNIWDCGGQPEFMENYFTSDRMKIFENTALLVYVFDMQSSAEELKEELKSYETCISALYDVSPSAKVYCLFNKSERIPKNKSENLFLKREEQIKNMSKPLECFCFMTSIWDETLYRAWSAIVMEFIPNQFAFKKMLESLSAAMECDEILLLDRSTCLTLCVHENDKYYDANRFEKISRYINNFQLTCKKLNSQITTMEVKHSNFVLYLEPITSNMFIMAVMSEFRTTSAMFSMNIKKVKMQFEKLELNIRVQELVKEIRINEPCETENQ